MTPKILFWLFVFLGVTFEIIGDILFKKWAESSDQMLLWVGFFVYGIGALFWAFSLKYEDLSKAIIIFSILNLIIIVLFGVFFFHEKLTNLHLIGIALGIMSIVLLEWEE